MCVCVYIYIYIYIYKENIWLNECYIGGVIKKDKNLYYIIFFILLVSLKKICIVC